MVQKVEGGWFVADGEWRKLDAFVSPLVRWAKQCEAALSD